MKAIAEISACKDHAVPKREASTDAKGLPCLALTFQVALQGMSPFSLTHSGFYHHNHLWTEWTLENLSPSGLSLPEARAHRHRYSDRGVEPASLLPRRRTSKGIFLQDQRNKRTGSRWSSVRQLLIPGSGGLGRRTCRGRISSRHSLCEPVLCQHFTPGRTPGGLFTCCCHL